MQAKPKPPSFFLVVVVLAVLAACLPGARAPHVTATRSLDVQGDPAAHPTDGAFAVAFGSPEGPVREASEVTLLFNRPMRPLEVAGQEEEASPAHITIEGGPAPRGSWRWLGTSALVFAPEGHLPDATSYVTTVPAGTRALSGEALAAPFTMAFSTPRPRVVDLQPADGNTQLVPGQTFEARFDQSVDLREVERVATLVLGNGRRIALRATRPQPQNAKLVKLTPATPLPLATPVVLTLAGSLRGTEGPLPMGADKVANMATYGPLGVSISCDENQAGKCAPGGGLSIDASNAVTLAQVRAHVSLSPQEALSWAPAEAGENTRLDYSVPVRLRAGRRYRVTVTAGLRDQYGQTLDRDVTRDLDVGDLPPMLSMGISGTVIEAQPGKTHQVPVTSVNLASYELAARALDERDVARMLAPSRSARVEDLPASSWQRVAPSATRNAGALKNMAVEPLLADHGGRGAFVLAARWDAGRDGRPAPRQELHIGNVTDLGLTAKMSRFGSLVWVTRLSDGKAVAGASVSVVDESATIFTAQTDADGIAVIPSAAYRPADEQGTIDEGRIVVARVGDDWTWRRVGDVFRWGGDGAWVSPSGGLGPIGMLIADRGVYRPGETVKLQAIARMATARSTETPAGRTVVLEASDAQGEAIGDARITLDAFGEASADLALPPTAHLGLASIRASMVNADGAEENVASTSVQLAAYKAAEFKVAVDSPARTWTHGDEGRFDLHGDYLFGAPMAGATVRWSVTRGVGWFSPPGADDLIVDDSAFARDLPDSSPRAARFESGTGALDAKGAYSAHASLALAGQVGTEVVTFEAEVQDVSRQTVAASETLLVHPAAFYVGLVRPTDWFVTAGDSIKVVAAAVEPGGKRRAGEAVHVDLVRRTWQSVLESTGESAGHWDSKALDAIVKSCDLRTTADFATCALPVGREGDYLVHATSRDAAGRTVSASYEVYAVGAGSDVSGGGWAQSDGSELALVPDKKKYEVGDTARILVKNPAREAEALVTVERAGIYRQQRVRLVGPAPTVTVAITEDMRPNAFVSVHLVRGRTKAAPSRGPDVGAPMFKSGIASLEIDPESRRLTVALTPAKHDLRPGNMVEADVLVKDRGGKPVVSELALWAVDEGVLSLTGYTTPDPIPAFTAPRPLAVFAMENRADLARIFRVSAGDLGVDKGDEGGGGGGESAMRADFKATAWFQAGVLTGPDGRAHVRFKLPDNLTTFRIMAVAAAKDDRFGSGEAQVTTSRPLMLRPALPRFLRAGDSMSAGVVVTTKGLGPQHVDVSLVAEGLTVSGDAQRAVDVPAGGSVEVRWTMASPRAGSAKLAFRAHAGAESDAVEIVRRIDVPATLETVALSGETRETTGERLGDLSAVRDDTGSLDVRVASTALVGVGDGMEQLLSYPYGCTEQLTSRLVPLVTARGLARDFGIALPSDPDALADEAIAKILANQREDGGFGWWVDSRQSDPWVTGYALWGLDTAARAGRPVPSSAIDRAAAWLHHELADLDRKGLLGLSTDAFTLDVLAMVGKADPGFINRLYDRRGELPLFARALLAHAIVKAKMDPKQASELLRDLDQHLRMTPGEASVVENLGDAYAPILHSEARTTAMVLRALVAIDPRHALASRLARGLLASRTQGQWRSTQEAAWALLALDDYRKAAEAEVPNFDARVWIGADLALDAPFHERSARTAGATVPIARVFAQGGAPLAFQVNGKGDLFYEATLHYARKDLPADPLDRGITVRKLVRAVTPDGLDDALATLPAQTQTHLPLGGLVLVDVVVMTTTPRLQVVIDDPLPAGLEPVDSTFATTASSASVDDGDPGGDPGQDDPDTIASGEAWGSSYFHREMRDDRVLTFVDSMDVGMYRYRYLARATTAGVFVVPATKAECMYEPAVFGRTAGSRLEVTP